MVPCKKLFGNTPYTCYGAADNENIVKSPTSHPHLHKIPVILQTMYSNAFSWMKILYFDKKKFHGVFLRV